MLYLEIGGDMCNELELEVMVEDLNRVIINTYESSYPVEIVASSRDVSFKNRNLARMIAEALK